MNCQISGEIIAYVDNLRTIGHNINAAWEIARQVASRLQHLGIQDDPRMRQVADGPWVGGIYQISNRRITKTVTSLNGKNTKTY